MSRTLTALVLLGAAACGRDQAPTPDVPVPQALAAGCTRVDLTADLDRLANRVDEGLVDPWGIVRGSSGFAIATQETGRLTILDHDGRASKEGEIASNAIELGEGVTGVVATHGETFTISADGTRYPVRYLFATLYGQLVAVVPDATPPIAATIVEPGDRASYTGIAVAGDRILAADFKNGRIDIFDHELGRISASATPSHSAAVFHDPELPAGYAPFNITAFEDRVVITYARQIDGRDQYGEGLGIVSEFDARGVFARRLATGGLLDAPWGLAMAPAGFCSLARPALLVANRGSGQIVPIDLDRLTPLEPLVDRHGEPIAIDGLWGLAFGDGKAGSRNELYFTAGFDGEEHGLFGRLENSQ
jgi:uncharacterized protein (TIGR03118 family)